MAGASSALLVSHHGRDRFDISIRGHTVQVDQPVADGGEDMAPTPTELLVASLASCVAFYGRRFLHRHDLDETLSVRADWTMGTSPNRVAAIEISVDVPGLPAALEPRFRRVVEHCTVHNTLVAPPHVAMDIALKEVA